MRKTTLIMTIFLILLIAVPIVEAKPTSLV